MGLYDLFGRASCISLVRTEVLLGLLRRQDDTIIKNRTQLSHVMPGSKKSDCDHCAHRILLGIYHVIKDGADFRDLGEAYLTRRNKSQKISHLHRQALALGFKLVPQTA